MKTNVTLFTFLIFILLISTSQASYGSLDSFERVKTHPRVCDRPAIDFFEGAIPGNGAIGVVVTTRPHAFVLYFGHYEVYLLIKPQTENFIASLDKNTQLRKEYWNNFKTGSK
jgi:hypothetical protein